MRFLRGIALTRLGQEAEALEVLRPAFASNPSDLYARMSESLLLGLEGDREGALTILRALDEQRQRLGSCDGETTFWLADLYARSGDSERALDSLELAMDQGFACTACIESTPALAGLPRSPRRQHLELRIGTQARERRLQAGFAS